MSALNFNWWIFTFPDCPASLGRAGTNILEASLPDVVK